MSSLPNSSGGTPGQQQSSDGTSPFNANAFLVRMMLARLATATLVKVMAVTNDGGVEPVGFVDILPLVNMVDGDGNASPHGTIFGCPYMRVQGGADAVILDPKVGDIGIAVFASRDLSSVIANKAQSNPGSDRRYDWADGLYVGGVLNGVPQQWIRFSDDGIELVSPTAIKLAAPSIDLKAPTVTIECETLGVTASTSATFDTPLLKVSGAVQVAETVTAAVVTAPIVAAGTSLTVQDVPIGLAHEHNLTGGGHTLGVKNP